VAQAGQQAGLVAQAPHRVRVLGPGASEELQRELRCHVRTLLRDLEHTTEATFSKLSEHVEAPHLTTSP